jgi:hypothetical protein
VSARRNQIRGRHREYMVEQEHFASGGAATIHATTDRNLVYKKYLNPSKAPDRRLLDRLVAHGREAAPLWHGPTAPRTARAMLNWPVDVVANGSGTVTGVILPRIPAVYSLPGGKLQTFDYLFLARTKPPDAVTRVGVLFRITEVLNLLHSLRLVHGDISSKNLVWAHPPQSQPIVYLIDCDGLVEQKPPPKTGYYTPGWIDPRLADKLIPAHDHLSDWYALALAMYRGLLVEPGDLTSRKDVTGRWPKPGSIPSTLDRTLQRLMHDALDDPLRGTRPTPEEWRVALHQIFNPARVREIEVASKRQEKIDKYRQSLQETRARQRRLNKP